MNHNSTSDARFERLGEHLEFARVDAELARMDAGDDLRRARAAWDEQRVNVARRLDEARQESAAALHSMRAALEEALRDLGETLDFAAHAP